MTRATDINSRDIVDPILIADWLGQQFLTPPVAERVRAMRSEQGQITLKRIGQSLDQQAATGTICELLLAGSASDVEVSLQRRYTALFEGIFRTRGTPPYASIWDGTGRLWGPAVGRMQALMRELNVHLNDNCAEPADHLAIQLTVLAEALRQDRYETVSALVAEMHSWTNNFTTALIQADGEGFYGNLARLLVALLNSLTVDGAAMANSEITNTTASL